MNQDRASTVFVFQMTIMFVKMNEIPIHHIPMHNHIRTHPPLKSLEKNQKQFCLNKMKWVNCSALKNHHQINNYTKKRIEEKMVPFQEPTAKTYRKNPDLGYKKSYFSETPPAPVHRLYMPNHPGIMNMHSLPDFQTRLPAKTFHMLPVHPGYYTPNFYYQMTRPVSKPNAKSPWSSPHPQAHVSNRPSTMVQSPPVISQSNVVHSQLTTKPSPALGVSNVVQQMAHKNMSNIIKFTQSLDHFERQFYMVTFTKLANISPADRQQNGMSFVQSSFFLLLTLMALSTDVEPNIRTEINRCIGFQPTNMETIDIIKHFMATLPSSSDKLKFRRSSRLLLWPGKEVSKAFRTGAAAALMLQIDRFNGTETSNNIANILNKKVEMDSAGAIRDTFEEEDVADGVTAVLVTTLYVRGSWRTAPTVLNGTRPFHDADNAPKRTVRMIRINDIMNYAYLSEWNAQALEVYYATPGLSLLMLIPRGNTLSNLVQHVGNTSIGTITAKMRKMRVAASVPLYTLRMTLLLPNKLQAMGIRSLLEAGNSTHTNSSLKLSHAVQRIMFWAEAGRNAYKDDGIEWDQTPDLQLVVDRPYIFFVRWHNITLLNGNFVL